MHGIRSSYKEELCAALLQACILETGMKAESVSVCLEICEVTSKVLDWRSSKSSLNKSKPQISLGAADFVTCHYL